MTMESLSGTAKLVSNELEPSKFEGNPSMQQFKSGDIMWIKIGKRSVWPGQVVDNGSVLFEPKKKLKDGVPIRIYGTYEYLYVDPVKCSSEVENILKQENISITEAFQKALEEDLSHLRSGGKSKRQVSKTKVNNSAENATADTPKRTGRKRDGRADASPALGASGEPKEVESSGKGRAPARVQPTRAGKRKQDEAAELDVTKQVSDGASKDQSSKRGRVKQPSAVPAGEEEDSGEKESKGDPSGKSKHAQNGTSKIKDKKQEASKESKSKNGSVLTRDEDVKELNGTTTPGTTKRCAPEESASDFSARRLKVMQSLGLIAPAGSPFRKNGFVVTSKLQ
ncbi:uncharacterized protein M6B38_273965 [Iris pallida]|uniref:PWWP domain-containing protein n=1 Tax=Iris pallida TaxID=29817 RepID=A0AAX6I5M5_IRIPA|nr:uncharacterized protein M6B38_273965 [Iris pallida]